MSRVVRRTQHESLHHGKTRLFRQCNDLATKTQHESLQHGKSLVRRYDDMDARQLEWLRSILVMAMTLSGPRRTMRHTNRVGDEA